jgi:16S rRNA (adenine1518-N6/adenine1519-N6)-dimethyltransferase
VSVRARKRFGQHFLESPWADKVVRAIAPAPTDTFLEIGPGRGALTRPLAAASARVVAIEIDRDLAADVSASTPPRVAVVTGDFLQMTAAEVRSALQQAGPPDARVRVAGNLAYNVASPILFRLVDLHASGLPLVDATVMLQREVADRLLAAPGSRDYGVLTVLIRHRARVTRLLDLPPGAFRPVPRVRSTVVRLTFHPPEPPVRDPAAFEAVVKAVFTKRRKTLANALAGHAHATGTTPAAVLAAARIDGSRRPETLSVEEFVRLADAHHSPADPDATTPRRAVL